MRSTGKRSKKFFFSPSAFGTSNLGNGASAASAAQSSWDLALRTADGSNGTAVAEEQQSSNSPGKYTASVELWADGLLPGRQECGCLASCKAVAMVIPTATAVVLQLPQQHRAYQLWITKLALAFHRYSLLSITATFFPFHQIFQHICNQFFGLRSLYFESLLFF